MVFTCPFDVKEEKRFNPWYESKFGHGVYGHLQGVVNLSNNRVETNVVDDVSAHVGFDGQMKGLLGGPDVIVAGRHAILFGIFDELRENVLIVQVSINLFRCRKLLQ